MDRAYVLRDILIYHQLSVNHVLIIVNSVTIIIKYLITLFVYHAIVLSLESIILRLIVAVLIFTNNHI
jgi:hypothetical protein